MSKVARSLFISVFGFWMLAAVVSTRSGKPECAAQEGRVEIGGSVD